MADAILQYYADNSKNTVYHQKCLARRCPLKFFMKNWC